MKVRITDVLNLQSTLDDLQAVGVSDGDKGDVTVSGSGSTWTIDNGVVTYAKLQNVSVTNRLLGRKTAGAGSAEELTGTDVTGMLDLFGSAAKGLAPASGGGTANYLRADGTWAAPPGAGIADGDKGDITVSSSGATWTIDTNAVTLAKLAQVSTQTFLGRNTASTGNVESLTASTVRTMLSINNVDNTSDANKPVSTATQTALDLKAPINNPTFTGTVTLAADPTLALQAATKQYVDNVAQGLDTKASVRVATVANIALTGTQTIDGIAVVAGNRVLVKNQTTAAQNGIYVVAAGAWSRAADMDTWAEVPGAYVFVEEGTSQADTGWVATSDSTGTLGTTSVDWAQFSGSGTYTASGGVTLTAKNFTLSPMAANTLKGNNTGSSAAPTDLTAAQVKTLLSLNNVDNTSDANKPVSTATQTALDLKVSKGAITTSELTMATNRLLGRTTAAAGALEEITVGTGLTFSGGTLSLTDNDWGSSVIAVGTGASQNITLPANIAKHRVLVYVNGIRYETAEYSIAGTTLTLTTNANGDSIEIIKL